MIVDSHMHIWDPSYLPPPLRLSLAREAAYKRMPYRDPMTILPRVTQGLADPTGELTVAEMDRVGIDVAVTVMVDYSVVCGEEAEIAVAAVLERFGGIQKRCPGRIYAFCGVDPRRPDASELFEKAITEWGLIGLKLYPPAGFYPYDPLCLPLYKRCLERGIPVAFHTSPIGPPLIPRYAHPMNIGDVQAAFPDLTIIFAHAGHRSWWQDAVEIAKGHPYSYLELSKWDEDAIKDPPGFLAKLAYMRDEVGAHRILFGSDFSIGPATSGEGSPWPRWVGYFRELPGYARVHGYDFSQEEVDLILGGNAERILRIRA